MKADGRFARDVAKYLGVSRATRYRYLADDAAQPPAGVRPCRFTPGGGIDQPAHPRRGYRPTCSPPAGVSTT